MFNFDKQHKYNSIILRKRRYFPVLCKCYETQFISTESELHTADIEQLTAVSYFSSLHHSIDKQMTLDALVGKGKVKLYCA